MTKSNNGHDETDSLENLLPETTDVNALIDELMPVQRSNRLLKSQETDSNSFDQHMAFLESIEADLCNQESGDFTAKIYPQTDNIVTGGKLRRLKSRFNNMHTLNAAGPKLLHGKARVVRRRAMLESCVQDLASICGPKTAQFTL